LFGGGAGNNVADASFSGLFAPVASNGSGKWSEPEEAPRNEMFFTVSVASKVVERKFVLQSDRRAAARRKNAPAVQTETFVPLAEQLAKLQQHGDEEQLDCVMTFAPHKHETVVHNHQTVLHKRETVAAEPVTPTKKFRSGAATRAAAQGGAVGVPMIPKMALTRPEEFDFATAARELAKEGTARVAALDEFELAEANVRCTQNKIGMYVDLDGDLDQETVVAKRATTGKKRNPNRSRLPMVEEGSMAQPVFDAIVPKSSHGASMQIEKTPPQLTVPKTPKFATASRARGKRDDDSRRPLGTIESVAQVPRKREGAQVKANPAPQKRAAIPLTVPRSPQFATTKRFNRP
jgi:hypothetical protein